ncbi:bi-domain-containing oxidoreductase [bacterium]|nr:bi-domain-containing oxidoreductase [bacterium]MBU1957249.1 bi-domain-containing oxidoreductase [bacterium]
MKQLIQNFKTGELYVDEVPMPSLSKAMVLVENRFSLISAGTERGTVSVAKASLIGKAKQRPDLVKQVLQNIRKEGLRATIDKVTTKLDSLKALGYSTAGVVSASMDTNGHFKAGDRVACAGQDYASHAEMVSVPQNLVVKIPDNVSFEEASFTTLGAIALQGVRQADPTLGENICVIGLGLLGQLTCQLLQANGCNVFGIDVSQGMVDLANETGVAKAMNRGDSNLLSSLDAFTNGYGFDKVIITAAAPTNDPVDLSCEILKRKGVIVVVGAVDMHIQREPFFYKKELELKISTSYGPGRYDVSYEEEGHDYPYSYVRWTEQRNMQAFLQLIANGSLDLNPLITHVFDIDDAEKAYDLVLGKVKERFIGILLKYPENDKKAKTLVSINNSAIKDLNIGFIGAGSFAQSYLLPTAKEWGSLDTVVTNTGINSKNVATKFGFSSSSTNSNDIMSNHKINTVFIATQHNTHAKFVLESIKADKHIFVEKPLAMNEDELQEIITAYSNSNKLLMVGFNRRFAPVSVRIKEEFQSISEPLVMNFRVNAGFIPKDHWTQTEAGGGRIVGEICHFIDLMQYFTDSLPIKVYADCIDTSSVKLKNDDNIIINIKFANGSVGTLTYIANGDKAMPKERFEISAGEKIAVIDDFKGGEIYKNNSVEKLKLVGKGHKQEIENFLNAVKEGKKSPIGFESICYTTLTTFKIVDSLNTGLPQEIIV